MMENLGKYLKEFGIYLINDGHHMIHTSQGFNKSRGFVHLPVNVEIIEPSLLH
jgi:hypothetical protein